MGGRTALRGNHGPVRLDAGRRPGPRGSRAAGRQGRGHRCRQGLSQPGADGRLLAGRVAARQLRAAGREGPAPGQHRRTPIAPHRTNRQGAAVHERRHREAVGAWQDRGGDAGQGSGHAAPDARLCAVPERSAPAARPADARRRLGRRRRPARHRRPDRWLRRSPRPSVAARRRRQAAGRVQSRWQAGAGRRRAGSAERAAHARLAPRRTGRAAGPADAGPLPMRGGARRPGAGRRHHRDRPILGIGGLAGRIRRRVWRRRGRRQAGRERHALCRPHRGRHALARRARQAHGPASAATHRPVPPRLRTGLCPGRRAHRGPRRQAVRTARFLRGRSSRAWCAS